MLEREANEILNVLVLEARVQTRVTDDHNVDRSVAHSLSACQCAFDGVAQTFAADPVSGRLDRHRHHLAHIPSGVDAPRSATIDCTSAANSSSDISTGMYRFRTSSCADSRSTRSVRPAA